MVEIFEIFLGLCNDAVNLICVRFGMYRLPLLVLFDLSQLSDILLAYGHLNRIPML
jgi:hypothetical protein